MLHVRVAGGAGADHRAAVRVPAHDRRTVERVEDTAQGGGVAVEVAERLGAGAVTGEIDRDRLHAARRESFDHAIPAPRAVPRAVDEDNGCRHAGGDYDSSGSTKKAIAQ